MRLQRSTALLMLHLITVSQVNTACQGEGVDNPLGPQLRSGGGIDFRERNRGLGDRELFSEVAMGDSVVLIGVKEAEAERGTTRQGVIQVSRETLEQFLADAQEIAGLSVIRDFNNLPIVIAKVTLDGLSSVRRDPRVDYALADYPPATLDPPATPQGGCPLTAQQLGWHIGRIKADSAWAWSLGAWPGPTTRRLTIFDSGFDYGTPDSTDPELPLVEFGVYEAGALQAHGTHVTAIAGARNNTVGAVGVAPLARMALFAIADEAGSGIDPSNVIEAIYDNAWLASVISMSFSHKDVGGNGQPPGGWNAVEQAIYWASNVFDVVFVASAGNMARPDVYNWPASLQRVIGVGGLNQNNGPVKANYPPNQVDISAPVTEIVTLCSGGGGPFVHPLPGTSWATPMVAAAAHMVRTVHTDWTWDEVWNRMRTTAHSEVHFPGFDARTGWGLLDVYEAVKVSQTPPSFSVSIDGTNPIRPYDTCTWVASVTAGVGPFSFQWYRDSMLVGTGASYEGSMEGAINFQLDVHVTDASMAVVMDHRVIASDTAATPCFGGP